MCDCVGLTAGGAQTERFRGKLSPIFSPVEGAPTTLADTMPTSRKQVKCLPREHFLILPTTRPFPDAWPFLPGTPRSFSQMHEIKDTLRATVRISYDGRVQKTFRGPKAE